MKKNIIILFIMSIVFFIVLEKILIIKVKYESNSSSYKVEINRISKNLRLYESNYCMDSDCNDQYIRISIKLTKEEYSYIKSILRQDYDKASFMRAISSLVKDDTKMFTSEQDGYDEKDDINNDGVVTYREFADSFLEILAK